MISTKSSYIKIHRIVMYLDGIKDREEFERRVAKKYEEGYKMVYKNPIIANMKIKATRWKVIFEKIL